MSSTPCVSVVVPTYNAPGLLRETLESVFAQEFKDFELVVVDDGSTDDTSGYLDQVAARDPRVRVIRQENAGIGGARNRGIAEARGKYVALLDHDDLWQPTKLAAQVAFLEEHPSCAAATSLWSLSTNPGVPQFTVEQVSQADGRVKRPLHVLAQGVPLMLTSTLMFVRDRALGLRYATRRKCIEDLPFQINLLTRGDFGVAGSQILTIYRTHESNYSKQAAFYFNGMRLLREMDTAGEFAGHQGQERRDLDEYLAYIARWASVMQLTGGFRAQALKLYAGEFMHQLRLRRVRFLATLPVLAMMPHAILMQRFGRFETR